MYNLNIHSLVIPASVEILRYYSISGCLMCKSIVFEAGSKLRTIERGDFDKYAEVECVLPLNVENVDPDIFADWTRLRRVNL